MVILILTTCISRFFRNKGAVAGVFLVAGLAAASILLFLFFFIRRRRRTRRLEMDHAMNSALAAHGFTRTPLDGGDDDEGGMAEAPRQGSGSFGMATMSSVPSGGGRPPSAYLDDPGAGPSNSNARDRDNPDFDPYAAYGTAVHPPAPSASGLFNTRTREGYAPARTSSPPPPSAPPLGQGHNHSHTASTSSMGPMLGHAQHESAGSFEPLLAAAGFLPATPDPAVTAGPPAVPPRSPKRPPAAPPGDDDVVGAGDHDGASEKVSASSLYSDDDQLVDLLPRPLEVRFYFASVSCSFVGVMIAYVFLHRYGTCLKARGPAQTSRESRRGSNNEHLLPDLLCFLPLRIIIIRLCYFLSAPKTLQQPARIWILRTNLVGFSVHTTEHTHGTFHVHASPSFCFSCFSSSHLSVVVHTSSTSYTHTDWNGQW